MFKLCELCAPVAVTLASSGTGTKVGTLATTTGGATVAATQLTNCHIFFLNLFANISSTSLSL